jgi:hypothetical protein
MGGGEGNPMAPDYTVNLVIANTPADGKLEPGDRIVAVNERYVEEGTLQNLKKLLGVCMPHPYHVAVQPHRFLAYSDPSLTYGCESNALLR